MLETEVFGGSMLVDKGSCLAICPLALSTLGILEVLNSLILMDHSPQLFRLTRSLIPKIVESHPSSFNLNLVLQAGEKMRKRKNNLNSTVASLPFLSMRVS